MSGELEAFVVYVKLAVSLATKLGVKTTFSEQDAEAARLDPQVLELVLKSAAFVPVNAMPEIASGPLPELVRVTAWFPLDVP